MAVKNNLSILERGEQMTLRVWRDEEPSDTKTDETRSYETVGYVISGVVEVVIDGRATTVHAGESYIVPKGTSHRYVVRERLTAVEAISPAQ